MEPRAQAQGDRHERGDRDRGEPAWANSQAKEKQIRKDCEGHERTVKFKCDGNSKDFPTPEL